ncbi:MAG: hypothetical protein INR65_04100 [Gluconacetobacter diazotrophicus]|nr:hypothetical protein [Gluconacetobacter diazotrophicus]
MTTMTLATRALPAAAARTPPTAAIIPAPGAPGDAERHDRPRFLAFIADADTEAALREGLAQASPDALDVRRGGVKAAMATLRRSATPQVLVVDVGGEKHPLTALERLSEVLEPDVTVLVIGDAQDLDTYRQITRGLGAADYLPKPITRERVFRHFAPLLAGGAGAAGEAVATGRLLSVTGVAGGVGATTVATSLAWHFAMEARRHTVLLDPDVHGGDAALTLDVKASPGLRAALEAPDRIDALFVERAAQPIMDGDKPTRLHVLAGEEGFADPLACAPDAAPRLLDALVRRYAVVVADVPAMPVPLFRTLLGAAHRRILVMPPTLAGVRSTLRLAAAWGGAPGTPGQRPVVVLNRLGVPGGLSRRQVEDGLKFPVDIVVADQPKQVGQAATMGRAACTASAGFRSAMAELARQVAFVRLLDGEGARAENGARSRRWLFRGGQ